MQASLQVLATQPAMHQLPALTLLQQQLTEVQTSLASTVAIFLESEAIVHWQNLMGLQQQLSALATSIEEQAQGSPVKPFPTLPFPALQPFPGSLQMPFRGPALQMPVPIAALRMPQAGSVNPI